MQLKHRRELVEKLTESMGVVMRVSGVVFRDELEKHGATFPQVHLMKMVSFHERITVTELAHIMMVAPPTASRMVETLCAKGLLERQKDDRDQRVTHIGLTRKGRNVLNKMEELQVSILLDLLEGVGERELEVFVETLGNLTGKWSEGAGKKV